MPDGSLIRIDSLTGEARVIEVVLDTLGSDHSKRAYGRALQSFFAWHEAQGRPPLSKAVVQGYVSELRKAGLSPASINQQLAAIRKLVGEAADNGALDQQTASIIKSIRGVRQEGRRAGNWLLKKQAQALIEAPDTSTPKGVRDRAILGVLLGCGLRRSEAASLELDQIEQRDGRWVILDLVGKRGRIRTVPMPNWCKAAIDEWVARAGISKGPLFQRINKGDRIYGGKVSSQAIHDIVIKYSTQVGIRIAPHDLRRSFGKLAHKGGAALEQIQLSLGHSSIKTTELYLGVEQDLNDAPCDHLGLHL